MPVTWPDRPARAEGPTTGPTTNPTTAAAAVARAKPTEGPAVVIQLSGEVNDFQRDQLFKHFAQARKLGAKTVILEIDTYGGLVTSALDISRFLKNQNDLHGIAYVNT